MIICTIPVQAQEGEVKVIGAMRNVMWKGELAGTVSPDSLPHLATLQGLGPLEYLSGEVMVLDGRSYVSRVSGDSMRMVRDTFNYSAPFFVYANVAKWKEQPLPAGVETIQQLEAYLGGLFPGEEKVFAFKLNGWVSSAKIHVVNLRPGTAVKKPEDAHEGQREFKLGEVEVEILGFFSTRHKGVFTHHDSNLHMHLLTRDQKMMGHLDDLSLKTGDLKLFLPE